MRNLSVLLFPIGGSGWPGNYRISDYYRIIPDTRYFKSHGLALLRLFPGLLNLQGGLKVVSSPVLFGICSRPSPSVEIN